MASLIPLDGRIRSPGGRRQERGPGAAGGWASSLDYPDSPVCSDCVIQGQALWLLASTLLVLCGPGQMTPLPLLSFFTPVVGMTVPASWLTGGLKEITNEPTQHGLWPASV